MKTEELVLILAPLGILAVNLPSDIRFRRIYPGLTLCGAAAGLAVRAVMKYPESGPAGVICAAFISVLPGVMLLLLAGLTHEKVGYGDGIMLLMLGSWSGASAALFSLIISLFYAVITGTAAGRNEIPFIPCLTAGFLTVVAFHYM